MILSVVASSETGRKRDQPSVRLHLLSQSRNGSVRQMGSLVKMMNVISGQCESKGV